MEKSAIFPGGYGRIGEILHGRIWPGWGNTARVDMAGLRKYCTGKYGRVGEILHGWIWPDGGLQG